MTIQYHTLSAQQYRDRRYLALLWLEESGVASLDIYQDKKFGNTGYATIGAGFKVDSNWNAILDAFGFVRTNPAEQTYITQIKDLVGTNRTFSDSGIDALQTQLDTIMRNRANDTNVTAPNKRLSFTFNNADEVEATFQVIAEDRETILDEWLGGISVPAYCSERVTLLSLVYNNVIGSGKSPILHDALENGNRAEAWYEIRYDSNGGSSRGPGIAKRRYYEADLFGLYNNPGSVDEAEAKTIMRMYTIHEFQETDPSKKISYYESTYGAQVAQANNDYQVTWVGTLKYNLNEAKQFLISNYAHLDGDPEPFASIDNVIVGAGLDSYAYTGESADDSFLQGTSVNDLIFGEKGNDTINGGSGNDVIYGGADSDTIDGGTGADIMYGGVGDDKYYVDNTSDAIAENADEGIDTVISTVTYHLPDNVDNLTLEGTDPINGVGNALDNVITGNNADNIIFGGVGNDNIIGGAGNNKLFGEADNDFIAGGKDSDYIDGGTGNDIISAGGGINTLSDESGNDQYHLVKGARDTISDADGSGSVYIDGMRLSGGKEESKCVYSDNYGNDYFWSGVDGQTVEKRSYAAFPLSFGVAAYVQSTPHFS